jgi:hypothetical protein
MNRFAAGRAEVSQEIQVAERLAKEISAQIEKSILGT